MKMAIIIDTESKGFLDTYNQGAPCHVKQMAIKHEIVYILRRLADSIESAPASCLKSNKTVWTINGDPAGYVEWTK